MVSGEKQYILSWINDQPAGDFRQITWISREFGLEELQRLRWNVLLGWHCRIGLPWEIFLVSWVGGFTVFKLHHLLSFGENILETTHHLLPLCSWVGPRDRPSLAFWWFGFSNKDLKKAIWDVIFFAVFWTLWTTGLRWSSTTFLLIGVWLLSYAKLVASWVITA